MDRRILRKATVIGVVVFFVFGILAFHHRNVFTEDKNHSDTSDPKPGTQKSWLRDGKNRERDLTADKECSRQQHMLPPEEALQRMSLESVAEVYHRYMNNLQKICPRKPIYGGMNAGWQICATSPKKPSMKVYFISTTKDEVIAAKFLKEIAVDTGASTVEVSSRLVLKAMAETETLSEETRPVRDMIEEPLIDILLVHAGNEAANIVHWLDTKSVLMNVDQLMVKFEGVGQKASKEDYIRQITLLARLHDNGFRIFHYTRDPTGGCIYKLNGRDVTGCYKVYMMRCKNTQPPIALPPPQELKDISNTNAALLYHSYSLSTEVLCKDVVRVGDIDDGGWEVCNDTNYRPSSNCLVYSFGIARDWTFDEEVSRIYGCEVHSFDPSIGLKDHKHSEKVWFHNMGLSNKDGTRGTWKMKTLDSIREMLGHQNRVLDFVKMDIEESEWGALTQMIKTGVLFNNVKQLGVEFHTPNVNPGKQYIFPLTTLHSLHNNGFSLYWAHPNQAKGNQRRLAGTNIDVTVCYELYYLNTKYGNS
ncbi:uncharacterized protein [Argopecten irradians]